MAERSPEAGGPQRTTQVTRKTPTDQDGLASEQKTPATQHIIIVPSSPPPSPPLSKIPEPAKRKLREIILYAFSEFRLLVLGIRQELSETIPSIQYIVVELVFHAVFLYGIWHLAKAVFGVHGN